MEEPDSETVGDPLTSRAVVLASGSPYRRALLQRLGIAFLTDAPAVDETARPGERPETLASRLARDKATRLAPRYPGALIIGADQVASSDGGILGKPGSHSRAAAQLAQLSGARALFHTAVCLLDTADGDCQLHVDTTEVHFRALEPDEIDRYLHRDQPYDCAGAFKGEALGIALFRRVISEDPTALIGLPLIWLADALRRRGLPVI